MSAHRSTSGALTRLGRRTRGPAGRRSGALTVPPPMWRPAVVQANLAILPKELADEFAALLPAQSEALLLSGAYPNRVILLAGIGLDIDDPHRHPALYRGMEGRWRAGRTSRGRAQVWRDDLVSFLIGCSFSFEEAGALDNGLPVRHIEQGRNVPMYRPNVPTHFRRAFPGRWWCPCGRSSPPT